MILPSIIRVYGKVFVNPPTLLESSDRRLELFRMYFNIDDFIDYLIHTLLDSKELLKKFNYLDRTIETLELIVDNYIAKLVYKVKNCKDYTSEIRDIKINSITRC